MLQGSGADRTFLVTGAVAGTVPANRIVASDPGVTGNVRLSTAGLKGFVGVTLAETDANGYVPVRLYGIVQVTAGAGGVTVNDTIASDATGNGVTIAPLNAGALKQSVGVALTTAAAGGLFDLLIQPNLVLA